MKRNKKLDFVLYIAGLICVVIFSFYIAAFFEGVSKDNLYHIKDNYNLIMNNLGIVFQKKYFNKISGTLICSASFFYTCFCLLKYFDVKKYMNGKEFGSAEKADIHKVNDFLRSHNDDINKPNMIPYSKDQSLFSKILYKNDDYKHIGYINTENRILSRNVMMNINGKGTHMLNANILVVGGSGAGKTQFFVRPQLMQMSSSFIITDPKGEVLKTCGPFLKKFGYRIRVLNFINEHEMKKSDGFNPFIYTRSMTDIDKLASNFIKNTTPSDATKGEPIWENGEKLLLSALMKYVYLESEEKTLKEVMRLLRKAKVLEDNRGNRIDSELDIIFNELEDREKMKNYMEKGIDECNHPAVIDYNKVMRGAADTVRSFIVCLNVRMGFLQNETLLDLLSVDEMNISEIGAGVDYDGCTKTAVFCVIPDSDKTYNSIIGMFYTLAFQELYYYADFKTEERTLPIPVTFMLDEFANVALPEDYPGLLSTMRSRGISSIIIIQNFAQIKKMYPNDLWEVIPGNCDVMIYLGGKESSTHKYVSEEMGEGTYDKKNMSVSKGRNGSTSNSYDKYGRKLLDPAEVGRLPNKMCIVMVRGQQPVFDYKIDTFHHPFWKYIKKANWNYNANNYRHKRENENKNNILKISTSLKISNYQLEDELFNELLENEDEKRHRVFNLSAEDFLSIDFNNENDFYKSLSDKRIVYNQKTNKELDGSIENEKKIRERNNKYFKEFLKLRKEGYDQEKTEALSELLEHNYTIFEIIDTFSPEMDIGEIENYKELLIESRKYS